MPRYLARLLIILVGSAWAIATHAESTAANPTVLGQIDSPESSANFGFSMARAGDVDGDGVSDFIVGAPTAGTSARGKVFLYLGVSGGMPSLAPWSAVGLQDGSHFGWSVCGGSDINADGNPDLVVGAPDFDGSGPNSGRVYIFLGTGGGFASSPSQTLSGAQTGAGFGYAVAFAGDTNHDGFADVIIGAPFEDEGQVDEGRAYLYLGSPTGLQTNPIWMTESNNPEAHYGAVVAAAGDVNRDGFDDLAVGAPDFNRDACGLANFLRPCRDAGRFYVYHGGPNGPAAVPTLAGSGGFQSHTGAALAAVGDFNNDGFPDFAVGSPGLRAVQDPTVKLYFGGPNGLSMTPSLFKGTDGERTGAAITGPGDLDGDGYDDIVAGSPDRRALNMPMGGIEIFFGSASGALTSPFRIFAGDAGENVGRTLAPTFDANNTCVPDFIVASSGDKVLFVDGSNPCDPPATIAHVSFQSIPSGLKIRLDGTLRTTPYSVDFSPNSFHRVSTFDQDLAPGVFCFFQGWSNPSIGDGTFLARTATYTARFSQCYGVIVDPSPNGTVTGLTPGYACLLPNSRVDFVAQPDCGFALTGWTVSGTTTFTESGNMLRLTLQHQAVHVRANFQPYQMDLTLATPDVLRYGNGDQREAWADYDGDGKEDVLVTSYFFQGYAFLYRNLGSGNFSLVPTNWSNKRNVRCPSWGDYDNDGDLDLYLIDDVVPAPMGGNSANVLLRNDGNGVFVDVTSGPLGDTGHGVGGGWIDYDRDGDLDLLVVNSGGGNKLLRNDGPSGFVDATDGTIATTSGTGAAAWGDYDNDGDPDLALATASGITLLRNEGAGGFSVVSNPDLNASDVHSLNWVDYDNDGDLDLFLGTKILNNNSGTLQATNLTFPSAWESQWADYDLDGDLDLYIASGGADRLFRNDGPAGFFEVNGPCGTTPEPMVFDATSGAGWSDIDLDGDPDLLLVRTRPCCFSSAENALWRTEAGVGRHHMEIKLVGTQSNRSGLGARVRIVTADGQQIRELHGNEGAGSQQGLMAHFGLGAQSLVDTVVVVWPSGVVQSETQLPADTLLTLWEPWNQETLAGNDVHTALSVFASCQFDSVQDAGTTELIQTERIPSLPPWPFQVLPQADPRFYEVRTTAVYGEGFEFRALIDSSFGAASGDAIRMIHFEENAEEAGWQDITTETSNAMVAGRSLTPGIYAVARLGDVTAVPSVSDTGNIWFLGGLPNPFVGMTSLQFSLPSRGHAELDIYDVSGRLVRNLFRGSLSAGPHTLPWDGRDSRGRLAPSGIYFYRLQSTVGSSFRKGIKLR